MGIFNNHPKNKHVHVAGGKKKKEPEIRPDIQVMMLGAKRAGKTCVLASMINQFDGNARDTDFVLKKVGGVKELDDALQKMKDYFKMGCRINEVLNVDENDANATSGFRGYDLELKIQNKTTVKPRRIRFVDCSGEWINDYKNEENMNEYIEHSDVIIIAIDSILLMEEDGRYNKLNHIAHVTNFIKNNMDPGDVSNNRKMILFVPLKCEKYFHENEDKQSYYYGKRLNKLNQRIKEEYSELLAFFQKPANKPFFTVAILPILTLGGIEFDEFTQESDDAFTLKYVRYRFCEPNEFAPKYCEQPLLYTLMFEQKKIDTLYRENSFAAKNKNKKLWAVILKEWFADKRNQVKDSDYIDELGKLKKYLKRSGDGFEIIQDTLGF